MKKFNKIPPALLVGMFLLCVTNVIIAATVAVNLGTATSFAVLAGAGITNTGPTTITGDTGTFPTTTEVGFGSVTINGTDHAGDGVTQGAKNDLTTAYLDAAGRIPTTTFVAGDNQLGGQTLTAGVYAFGHATTANLVGTLILDAENDPDAVFIFQASSDLITASGSVVQLINGAQPCNVFWQVTSSATLGTGSTFKGTIMALTSITVTSSVTVDGRVLARNATVTLDSDTIIRPACTSGSLSNTAGPATDQQSFPWSVVIVALAAISTISIFSSVAKRRQAK